MKRTELPPRRAWIRRRAKPSPGGTPRTRKPRKPSEFARIFGSKQRVAWIKAQPCALSPCEGTSENAHVRTGGIGRKADACWIIPLCREHHRQLHEWGQRTFAATYGIELLATAKRTEAAWRSSSGEAA